jgi:hypothetical protein
MEVATYKRDGDGVTVAHVVDYEGEGRQGEGHDKMSALCDLARELWDEHDPALFDCLAAIMRLDAEHEDRSGSSSEAGWGLRQAARTLEGIV